MTTFDTLGRLVLALIALGSATPLLADSTLNFPLPIGGGRTSMSLSIQNPSPYFADVEFALYEVDGSQRSTGIANPVRYRVAPHGEISLGATEIFHTDQVHGWIQATSVNSSLRGSYLWGDFESLLDGGPAPEALSTQVVPFTAPSTGDARRLIVLNPSPSFENLLITVYDPRGSPVARITPGIGGRGLVHFNLDSVFTGLPDGDLNVIITASAPVVATATVESDRSVLLIRGQPVDRRSRQRVLPHPISAPIFRSTIVLSNPTPFARTVNLTFFQADGVRIVPSPLAPVSLTRVVPAHGIASLSIADSLEARYAELENGWILIDSEDVPLAVLLMINEREARTAIEASDTAVSRGHYAHAATAASSLDTQLFLVNGSNGDANANVGVVGASGRLKSQATIVVPSGTSLTGTPAQLGLETDGEQGDFLAFESSVPLYGFGLLRSGGGTQLTHNFSFQTSFAVASARIETRPEISSIEPVSVHPTENFAVYASGFGTNPSFLVSGRKIPALVVDPDRGLLTGELPADTPPGFVSVRVTSEAGTSRPVELRVESGFVSLGEFIVGRAFYQKINVGAEGLKLNRPVMVPIRYALVEVVDPASDEILSASQTNGLGWFRALVPGDRTINVRISSRLRDLPLSVLDNQNQNTTYTVEASLDPLSPVTVLTMVAMDENRVSGAFNILEVLQRANDLLRFTDPNLSLEGVSVFWSPENTPGDAIFGSSGVQSSFFDPALNAAYVVGDRSVDSDEFDDSVILHEYAHFLADQFSRDDSNGGPHFPGNILDPRVAWSEGWANFFAGLVQGHSDYRDSAGPAGAEGIRFDLEVNSVESSSPGYWDEFSVHSLLWDLIDVSDDAGDQVSLPYGLIWQAFTGLRDENFVYLPVFLEQILERAPETARGLEELAIARNISFLPFAIPSVADPFPKPIELGTVRAGELDSLTSRRTNLMQSAHLFAFETSGANISLKMRVTGTGPARRRDRNDLDLLLMNSNGDVIGRSDRGLNGQSERIAMNLEPGWYVVEIRSFFRDAETNRFVFNSGQYELSLDQH